MRNKIDISKEGTEFEHSLVYNENIQKQPTKEFFKNYVNVNQYFHFSKDEIQQLYEEFINQYYNKHLEEIIEKMCKTKPYISYEVIFNEYINNFLEQKGIIIREDLKMKNYINLLKDKEEELNKICRQKGFELTITIVNQENNFGEIHIKRLNDIFPTNFTIKVLLPFNVYIIDILNNNGKYVSQTNINDLPKWIYNYLNYDKVQFVCNFIGGEYNGQTMNREEIEKICNKSNTIIPKVTKSECSSFDDIIKYNPSVDKYPYLKLPTKVDFGTIYYTYFETIHNIYVEDLNSK